MRAVDSEFGTKLKNHNYINREAVYGVLLQNSQVAIVKTPRGYFLPGGGVELNEDHETCLKREMIEETGIEVTVNQYIGKSVLYDKSPKDNVYYNMYGSFYLVSQIALKKKIENDHAVVFMSIHDAIIKLQLIHQKWALKEYLANTM
jgi:8-oxo-dGTP diphosphatase